LFNGRTPAFSGGSAPRRIANFADASVKLNGLADAPASDTDEGRPDLSGRHVYVRVNSMAGANYKFTPATIRGSWQLIDPASRSRE
jgi:hypothetical protein